MRLDEESCFVQIFLFPGKGMNSQRLPKLLATHDDEISAYL